MTVSRIGFGQLKWIRLFTLLDRPLSRGSAHETETQQRTCPSLSESGAGPHHHHPVNPESQ